MYMLLVNKKKLSNLICQIVSTNFAEYCNYAHLIIHLKL